MVLWPWTSAVAKEETCSSGRREGFHILSVLVSMVPHSIPSDLHEVLFLLTDISSESINAAQERYRSRKMIDRRGNLPYSADFYVTDCTAVSR